MQEAAWAAQRDEVNYVWRAASHSLAGEASAQEVSWKSMVINPSMLSFATIANITHLQRWFTSHIFYWLLTVWVWLTIQDSCPLWSSDTQSPILKAPHLYLTLYFHPCLTGQGKPCDLPNLSVGGKGVKFLQGSKWDEDQEQMEVPGIVTVRPGSIQNRKYLQEDQTLIMTPLSDGWSIKEVCPCSQVPAVSCPPA